MAGGIGNVLGTTYNLPNFVGELFGLTPTETPLLSMIGSLSSGKGVRSKTWNWQTYDLADASSPGGATGLLEGADPTLGARVRGEVSNCVQIFQYGVKLSYSDLASRELVANTIATLQNQPIQDEMAWQLMLLLEMAARDVEYVFLNGTYQNPSDNNTGRRTRGIRSAMTSNIVTTNVEETFTAAASGDLWTLSTHGFALGDEIQITTVGTGGGGLAIDTPYWVISLDSADTFTVSATKGGSVVTVTGDTAGTWKLTRSADLSKSNIDNLVRTMFDAGAPLRQPIIFSGSFNKQAFSTIYGYAPESRSVGGLNIQQVETDFGTYGIVVDRHLKTSEIYLLDLSVMAPVFMEIPNKGAFFVEPLAKTGSYELNQLYGEIGLEYGPELWHGKITGTTTVL